MNTQYILFLSALILHLNLSAMDEDDDEELTVLHHSIKGFYNTTFDNEPVNFSQTINNILPKHGFTLLQTAAKVGNLNAVHYLLSKNANVNAANHMQTTPLMLAAKNGHSSIVHMLLQNNADTRVTNRYDKTASMLTREEILKERAQLKKPSKNFCSSLCSIGYRIVLRLKIRKLEKIAQTLEQLEKTERN